MVEIAERAGFKSPEHLFRPRSVAIVGASERARWPKLIHGMLRQHGYPGKVYPINPRTSEIWGTRCYRDLASLPEPPDHAIVIVPAPAVVPVLEAGVAAGLRSATVYSSGIGEGTLEGSSERGHALRQLIQRSGLAVIGPNCMGATAYRERYFGYATADVCDVPVGSVGLVSQSGGTVRYLARHGGDRGLKFAYAVSSGNEIDLDLADYVHFFVTNDDVKVIALFIEGLRRPRQFLAAADMALKAGKPIVVLKSGRSQQARESAFSHTGAVAGDYAVFEAMCRRYGIVNCTTLDEMIEVLLAFQPGRLPKGRRLGVVTTSGGTVDLLHDVQEDVPGVRMPPFSRATTERIASLLAPGTRISNPLDGGDPPADSVLADVCKAVLDDPGIDMLAWASTLPAGPKDAKPFRSVLEHSSKPVLAFNRMAYHYPPSALQFQDEAGFPFLQGLPHLLRATAALGFYAERSGQSVAPVPPPKAGQAHLDRACVIARLAERGLREPRTRFARTAAEAAAAAEEIGFPVAVKIVTRDLTHKTEAGGVLLGLDTQAKVERGARELASNLERAMPAAHLDGYQVQEMVAGVEVLLGVRTDAQLGPILVIGAGGILVELVSDVAIELLPVDRDLVREMIGRLRIAKLLSGYRGRPAADMEALVTAALALAETYQECRSAIVECEINPLIVLEAGKGARAVDIRMRIA